MRKATLATALVLACAACQPDEQRAGDVSREDMQEARTALGPVAAAQLDSGNTAYRGRDYRAALAYYEAAARAQPDAAAPWFGVYMAQTALGNAEQADAAMRRAQELQPGATLIHPTTADTAAPARP